MQYETAFVVSRALLIAAVSSVFAPERGTRLSHAAGAAHSAAAETSDQVRHQPGSFTVPDAAKYAVYAYRHAGSYTASNAADAAEAGFSRWGIYQTIMTKDVLTPGSWPPLWHDLGMPKPLEEAWNILRDDLVVQSDYWVFWVSWYESLLKGAPIDWSLLYEITSRLTKEDWESSPPEVYDRIKEIESHYLNLSNGNLRQPSFEPKAVDRIFEQKLSVSSFIKCVSLEISTAIETFHRESGQNEIPEELRPLTTIPDSLIRIDNILVNEKNETSEQALREEIGRLNAKIAKLESELEKLRHSVGSVFSESLKKQIAKSLGDWKLYAAMTAGLWVLSGDDLGSQLRLQNILSLRETIFGADCPTPKTGGSSPPRFSADI